MSSTYHYVKLKELCDVNQGLQIPIEERFTTNAPNRYFYITVQFLKASHTNKFYVENPPESSICREEDILIVRTGSTGQLVTGVSGCFHNNFFKVNFNKELIHGRYLYHCLNTKEKYREMLRRAGVTTIPDLNHFMFLDIEIPLPDKNNQIKIAKTLDSLDSKIELNNRINAELEAMAKTLYDYWFVQFDFPDANGKPYKTSGGKMVWNADLKREIPEGWEVKKIESVTKKINSGGTPSTIRNDFYNGNIPWYATNELQDDFLIGSKNLITDIAVNESSAKLFPADTILLAIYAAPTVGRLGILTQPSTFNQACCGILADENVVSKEYLFFTLFSMRKQFNSIAVGTAQKNLSVGQLKVLYILVPPQKINTLFKLQAKGLFDKKLSNQKENQKLTELRDWLLPMLMNGQVKVQ